MRRASPASRRDEATRYAIAAQGDDPLATRANVMHWRELWREHEIAMFATTNASSYAAEIRMRKQELRLRPFRRMT